MEVFAIINIFYDVVFEFLQVISKNLFLNFKQK